jgi:hypothetical protein
MRKFLIIAAVALATLGALSALAIGTVMMAVTPFAQSSGPRPNDTEMIAHWRAHRSVLEQLAGIMKEDAKLKRIGKDWIDPDDGSGGITAERMALYRKLMDEAKILVAKHYGDQVKFVYYTRGTDIRGSAKSFFLRAAFGFCRKDRQRPRPGRRPGRPRTPARYMFQRYIEGEWWLQTDGT